MVLKVPTQVNQIPFLSCYPGHEWMECVCVCVCTHANVHMYRDIREGGEEKITEVLNLKPCKNLVKEGVERWADHHVQFMYQTKKAGLSDRRVIQSDWQFR